MGNKPGQRTERDSERLNFTFLLTLFCIFISLLIAMEDFKAREVRVLWFVLLSGSLLFRSYCISGLDVLLIAALNLLIILFQLIALWGYFKLIRNVTLFDVALGWGDVMMLVALVPAFSSLNFVAFNLCGYVVAILYCAIARPGKRLIPLAGIQALLFSALLFFTAATKSYYLPFNDTIWLNLIARYV